MPAVIFNITLKILKMGLENYLYYILGDRIVFKLRKHVLVSGHVTY